MPLCTFVGGRGAGGCHGGSVLWVAGRLGFVLIGVMFACTIRTPFCGGARLSPLGVGVLWCTLVHASGSSCKKTLHSLHYAFAHVSDVSFKPLTWP